MRTKPRLWTQVSRLFGGALVLATTGCTLLPIQTAELHRAWPADLPPKAELTEVPFFPQDDHQCGPAALATALSFSGVDVTPAQLTDQVYLPMRQGSLQVDMVAAPRRYERVPYLLSPRLDAVFREVSSGTPVLVMQDVGGWPFTAWHYAVVVGYDQQRETVTLRSGRQARLTMSLALFELTWRKSRQWAMVIQPMDRIPASTDESGYLPALLASVRVNPPHAARSAFSAFLKRWPDNLVARIGLANALHAQGELTAAEAELRRAGETHPESAAVWNNLAMTLSDQGRQEEALAVLARVRDRTGPFADAIKDTRDRIHQRAGL